MVHAHFLHAFYQALWVKERAVEPILQLRDVEGDSLAGCRLAMHAIRCGLFNKPREWLGYVVDVNVGDHGPQPQSPR